jgi:hypothetical protein
MPLLQPQRQLSARLLLETKEQKRTTLLPDAAEWTESLQKRIGIVLTSYSARLRNLVAALRRPGYALIVLLFFLLTSVAGIGVINYASSRNISLESYLSYENTSEFREPHLVASTTDIAFSINKNPSTGLDTLKAQKVFMVAQAQFMLKNAGGQSLLWNFDRTRSVIFFPNNAIMISTQPSHGVLKGNAYSPVLITASGISYENLAFSGIERFARIVFSSNGGDVSLQATLKKPTIVEPGMSFRPQLSYERNSALLSMHQDYLLRKQKL